MAMINLSSEAAPPIPRPILAAVYNVFGILALLGAGALCLQAMGTRDITRADATTMLLEAGLAVVSSLLLFGLAQLVTYIARAAVAAERTADTSARSLSALASISRSVDTLPVRKSLESPVQN